MSRARITVGLVALAAAGIMAAVSPGAAFDFQAAYNQASPGATICVPDGAYGSTTLNPGGPADVTFDACGNKVVVDSLTVNTSSVTFKGMRLGIWYVQSCGGQGQHDVTFQDDTGSAFYVSGGVQNVTVDGGDYGQAVNYHPQVGACNPNDPASPTPTGVTIERLALHDFSRDSQLVHTECLQLLGGTNLVIARNRMWACSGTADLGISNGPFRDLTIENNQLGLGGDQGDSVQMTGDQNGLTFDYNTATGAVVWGNDHTPSGVVSFTGNYMPWNYQQCNRGVFSHNVWVVSGTFAGATCSSTDKSVTAFQTVNSTTDLTLLPGSAAADAGDPLSFPPLDIYGNPRPSGPAPDAGAGELYEGPPPPPPIGTPTATGTMVICNPSTARLTWTAVAGAVRYLLYRDGVKVAATKTALSARFSVACGAHTLAVAAQDTDGNLGQLATVTVP